MATKTTKSSAKTTKAPAAQKKSTRAKAVAAPQKVDYYPNRMTFAISALGGTLLVLLAVIVAVNS